MQAPSRGEACHSTLSPSRAAARSAANGATTGSPQRCAVLALVAIVVIAPPARRARPGRDVLCRPHPISRSVRRPKRSHSSAICPARTPIRMGVHFRAVMKSPCLPMEASVAGSSRVGSRARAP